MPAEFGLADNFVIGQIHCWRFYLIADRRKMVPPRMTTPVVVPILRHAKDVVQVLLANYAARIEHLVFERLNHSLNERRKLGDRAGVFLILQPVERNTSSNDSTYFVSWSRCRISHGRFSSCRCI